MLDDLKNLFRSRNVIGQLIVINAAVFLLFNVIANLFMQGNETIFLSWLGLSSDFMLFIIKPWTLATYMFLHGGFWHLLFNMLMLYWFGRIIQDFMGEQRLLGLYILGGLAGGLLYLLLFNVLSLAGSSWAFYSTLIGASAAVMAVVVAAGAKFPDYTLNLLLIGPVRLKYVALVVFLMSTILDFSSNTGGKVAHLGGAVFGLLYVRQLNHGQDWAWGFTQFFYRFRDMFERKPRLKVVHKEPSSKGRAKTVAVDKDSQVKTDAILDKISKSGYDSLTKEEKDYLFKLSNNR